VARLASPSPQEPIPQSLLSPFFTVAKFSPPRSSESPSTATHLVEYCIFCEQILLFCSFFFLSARPDTFVCFPRLRLMRDLRPSLSVERGDFPALPFWLSWDPKCFPTTDCTLRHLGVPNLSVETFFLDLLLLRPGDRFSRSFQHLARRPSPVFLLVITGSQPVLREFLICSIKIVVHPPPNGL